MNPEDDDREPIDVLYDIEEKVQECAKGTERLSDVEPRLNVKPGTKQRKILQYIKDHAPVPSGDGFEGVDDNSVRRTLSKLWYSYYVDRTDGSGGYVYTITPLGERALSTKQQDLSEGADDRTSPSHPWEGHHNISRTKYEALRAVRDTDGHPTASEMNDLFIERSGATEQKGTSYAISSRLSELYSSGHLDRTPDRPFVYWLTTKGKEVLND